MTFNDLVGQNTAINRLKDYIACANVDATYLFSGPEGVGKFTSAKIFAAALNCLSPKDTPCGVCSGCRKIEQSQHPDVHIIDCGTSEIKVEQVRQLQQEICLRPYQARKKVFVVNNAHNLNLVSANSLLKTLEEPPADSVIILVTDKQPLILKTIVSRCRIIKFYPMPRTALEEFLVKRTDGTQMLSKDRAHYCAYVAEGRLGYALQCIEQDIFTHKNAILDSLFVTRSFDPESSSVKQRDNIRGLLYILATWFRDVYLYKNGIPQDDLIHYDRRDMVKDHARIYTSPELQQIINLISQSFYYLDQNVNTKLLLANIYTAMLPKQHAMERI